jgi:hypothetical protein
MIIGDMNLDMIKVWAQKHLGALLMSKRATVEAEATASFDHQGIWDAHLAAMTAKLDCDLAAYLC